jgi:hypothetical protein
MNPALNIGLIDMQRWFYKNAEKKGDEQPEIVNVASHKIALRCLK